MRASGKSGGAAGDEHTIRLLTQSTGASVDEVQALFARELKRLEVGARVRSYLTVLAVASVRVLLRRKGAALSGVQVEPVPLRVAAGDARA
jgi:hypothetical protein